MRFVPDLCQTSPDLAHLDDLGERKNNNLRGINGWPETDSVPGHHILKHLVAAKNIRFQSRELYANIGQPTFALSHFSISFQISRAVLPVLAMCCRASFA